MANFAAQLLHINASQLLAQHVHGPRGWMREGTAKIQNRRLAGTVWPQQRPVFPGPDIKIDPSQDLGSPAPERHVLQTHHTGRRRGIGSRMRYMRIVHRADYRRWSG